MQHIFVSHSGKTFAPDFFTVYYIADGSTYKRLEDELNDCLFSGHPDVIKIELYENKIPNGNPILKEVIYKQDYTATIIVQYSSISKAG